MIQPIIGIARNTFKEAIREKALVGIGIFTFLLILASKFLGQLSLGADAKVIKDMGLASIMVLGAFLSIFMGVGLIYKEIDRRTIYTILTKPVSKLSFVIGKFFGLSATILLEVIFMTAVMYGILAYQGSVLDPGLLKAVYCIFLELNVLIAFCLLISTYSSSLISTLFAFGFWVLGHLADDFQAIISSALGKTLFAEDPNGWVSQGAYFLLNFMNDVSLDRFAINAEVVHGVPIGAPYLWRVTLFALALIVFLLTLANWIFLSKDLK